MDKEGGGSLRASSRDASLNFVMSGSASADPETLTPNLIWIRSKKRLRARGGNSSEEIDVAGARWRMARPARKE